MHITSYSDSNLLEWDAFVAANPLASYGHLSSTFALARHHSGAVNRSLMLHADDGSLIGILPLFEIESRVLGVIPHRVLASGADFPAGPLFRKALAAAAQEEGLRMLLEEAAALGHKLKADEIAINYPNVMGRVPSILKPGYLPLREYAYTERNKVYFLIDLRAEEKDLLANLRANCRNHIRSAQRKGVSVRALETRDEWLACDELNQQTLGSAKLSVKALEVIWDEFVAKGFATALAAVVDGSMVNVVVMVHFNRAAYYWFGFNRKPQPISGANQCALWEAILQCKRLKAEFLDLGSKSFAGDKLMAISTFKEAFGGAPTYSLCGALGLRPWKKQLVDLAELTLRSAPSFKFKTVKRPEPAANTVPAGPKAVVQAIGPLPS
jgi:hypothetical protein